MKSGQRQACCESDEDALCKLWALAVPPFSRGYQTPLLYRFKHYAPAAGFVKVGCGFFQLQPCTLHKMGSMASHSSDAELCALVAVFLHDSAPVDEADIHRLIAEALDADRDYAAQNGVRRRKVVPKPQTL